MKIPKTFTAEKDLGVKINELLEPPKPDIKREEYESKRALLDDILKDVSAGYRITSNKGLDIIQKVSGALNQEGYKYYFPSKIFREVSYSMQKHMDMCNYWVREGGENKIDLLSLQRMDDLKGRFVFAKGISTPDLEDFCMKLAKCTYKQRKENHLRSNMLYGEKLGLLLGTTAGMLLNYYISNSLEADYMKNIMVALMISVPIASLGFILGGMTERMIKTEYSDSRIAKCLGEKHKNRRNRKLKGLCSYFTDDQAEALAKAIL